MVEVHGWSGVALLRRCLLSKDLNGMSSEPCGCLDKSIGGEQKDQPEHKP